MKIKFVIFFFILCFNLQSPIFSNINDKIVAKIGSQIITNFDIINEVNTILALSNRTAKESNLQDLKKIAFSSLKKINIKKAEIEKYKIKDFNQSDVDNYISGIEKNLRLQNINLEDHFKKFRANYDIFVQGVIINLKWNTLIYSLYRKQLDIDEELIKTELNKLLKETKKIDEFNLSEIVLEKWDENILKTVEQSISDNGFEKTATQYSNSVSSAKGGLIGWLASNSISNEYLNEIKKLKKLQISKPIRMNNNIVIIKLNDKRSFDQNNIDVVKLENNIINRKKEEKLNIFSNSHYLDLEKKSYLEINE